MINRIQRKLRVKQANGYTLIELMIAISIFGLLMIYVAQLMRTEIRSFDEAMRQNEVEQKARVAMMQVLDEIRLQSYTYYSYGSGTNPGPEMAADSGVYYYDPDNNGAITCLVNVNPSNPNLLPYGTVIYYDSTTHELWYRDPQTMVEYLISDEISSFSITAVDPADVHFVEVYLQAGDPATNISYELLTWVRLY